MTKDEILEDVLSDALPFDTSNTDVPSVDVEDTMLGMDLPRAEVYAYTNRHGDRKLTGSASWRNMEAPDSPALDSPETRPSYLYVQPVGFSWGDYVGGTAERSNYNVFMDRHGDKDGIHEVRGSHGSHSILIRGDVSDEHVLEDVAAVAEYPVLDTEDMSRLEFAREQFALGEDAYEEYEDRHGISGWKGDSLDEFRKAVRHQVVSVLEEDAQKLDRAASNLGVPSGTSLEDTIGRVLDEVAEFPDEELRNIFWKHAQRGVDVIHETATGRPYMDVDSVASTVDPLVFTP